MPKLPPLRLPVLEWMPDMPTLNNPGISRADGCVPVTEMSYGPVGSYANFATALTARCQGQAAVQDLSGNVYLFAGDVSKLYKMGTGDTAFTNVSRAGSYSCPTDESWAIVAFGNRVIASNITDGMETFLIGTDTLFSDLGGGSPRARCLLVLRDFVVAGNTYDATNGNQPMRVWWCAIGNPLSWPTPGTTAAVQVQSDYQDMIGDYGQIVGLAGPLGAADAAVVMQRGIFRMQYSGSPAIFDFALASGARGSQAPLSLVVVANTLYYLGDDDFYAFDGINTKPLAFQKWAKYFWDNVDPIYLARVQGAADPQSKLIFWGYPTPGSNGALTDVIAYNWALDRASHFTLSAEWIGRSLSTGGLTLDQFGVLDSLLFPLDSRAYQGGKPILSVFDTSHRLGFLSGSNMAVTIDTSERQIFPGRRARYSGARPLVDGSGSSVSLAVRETNAATVAFNTAVAVNRLGLCPHRLTGRYVKAEITVPAATTFSHIQGVDLEAMPEGMR